MILNLSPLAAPRTILAAPTTAAAERRCMWCGTYDLGERGCEPYTVRSEPAAPVMRFARWLILHSSARRCRRGSRCASFAALPASNNTEFLLSTPQR